MTRTKTDHLVVLEEWKECSSSQRHIIYNTIPEIFPASYHDSFMRLVYDAVLNDIQVQVLIPVTSGEVWESVPEFIIRDDTLPFFYDAFQSYLDGHAL